MNVYIDYCIKRVFIIWYLKLRFVFVIKDDVFRFFVLILIIVIYLFWVLKII